MSEQDESPSKTGGPLGRVVALGAIGGGSYWAVTAVSGSGETGVVAATVVVALFYFALRAGDEPELTQGGSERAEEPERTDRPAEDDERSDRYLGPIEDGEYPWLDWREEGWDVPCPACGEEVPNESLSFRAHWHGSDCPGPETVSDSTWQQLGVDAATAFVWHENEPAEGSDVDPDTRSGGAVTESDTDDEGWQSEAGESLHDELATIETALEESRSLLAAGAYDRGLEHVAEGLAAFERIEGRVSDGAEGDPIRERRDDLRWVRDELERCRETERRLEGARDTSAAAREALDTGDYDRAEAALEELHETLATLDGETREVDAVTELEQTTRLLEGELAAARADQRVVGLLGAAESHRSRAESLDERGEHEQAESLLTSARESLDEASELNAEHGLGRDDAIEASRAAVAGVADEIDAADEFRDELDAAEAAIARGIERREADDPDAALEAFEEAHERYESIHECCAANGRPQEWEVEQRRSMVASYVESAKDAVEERRQSTRAAVERKLETAASELDTTAQYVEVEDYVSAQDALGTATGVLDETAQLLDEEYIDASHRDRYDDLVERAEAFDERLPREDATGEYSTQRLVDALQRLATLLGESPRPAFVNAYSQFPADAYLDAFGSWPDTLAAASLDPIDEEVRERRTYSRVEVLDAVVECARELGHAPSQYEMNQHGAVSGTTVTNRFRDWETALELAGLHEGDVAPAEPDVQAETGEPDVTDSEAASSSAEGLAPNELAELYEVFRTLALYLSAVIETDERAAGSPLSRWHDAVRRRWAGSRTEDGPSYEYQQYRRNTFGIDEYRTVYGDGERITEFTVIETAGVPDDVRERLVDRDVIEPAESVIVPVAPESETPLPVFIESESELQAALALLDEFPAYPEADRPPERTQRAGSGSGDQSEMASQSKRTEKSRKTSGLEDQKSESEGESGSMVTDIMKDMGFSSEGSKVDD
jgi:tetratricopeptide (TPR) repeat protein